jgi:hypothetical protein
MAKLLDVVLYTGGLRHHYVFMKHTVRLLFSATVFAALSASAFAQTNSRESKRLDQGKITKNEAQHLVLTQFPGASIKKCELHPGKTHSIWQVTLVKKGEQKSTNVRLDGNTGKILP